MKRKMLVALDDSESSHEAARFVRDFFGDDDTEVLGVNVAEYPQPWIAPGIGYGVVIPPFPVDVPDQLSTVPEARAITEARSHAAAALAESGLDDASALGAVGDPVAAIVRAAEETDADLIVVGGDDAGFLGRLLDRSVARALLRESRCPVLVVPSSADEGGPQ